MGDVLAEQSSLLRETFGAAGGSEIDTQGDAFFFAFPRAREAVTAAVEVQRAHAVAVWPDGVEVRVRIGLHTGEPAVGAEGYLGLDVVRAARICTVARGGNVLISETTRALVGSSLPEGVSVFPLGERHLKGIDEPERVYELEIEGVPTTPEPEAAGGPEPAPAPLAEPPPARKSREKDFERRFEDFGQRLADSIQERVLGKLESALGKAAPPASSADDGDVDDMAARAASFEDKIRARVEASLRASGIDPDDPR